MAEAECRAAEIRPVGFARGLGLDEAAALKIYEAVWREAAAAGVSDNDRMAKVRKPLLTAPMAEPVAKKGLNPYATPTPNAIAFCAMGTY